MLCRVNILTEKTGIPAVVFSFSETRTEKEDCLLNLLIKTEGLSTPFGTFFFTRIHFIEVMLGPQIGNGRFYCAEKWPRKNKIRPSTNAAVGGLHVENVKRNLGFAEVTLLLSMHHNKPEQYVQLIIQQRVKMADFFCPGDILCVFARCLDGSAPHP